MKSDPVPNKGQLRVLSVAEHDRPANHRDPGHEGKQNRTDEKSSLKDGDQLVKKDLAQTG